MKKDYGYSTVSLKKEILNKAKENAKKNDMKMHEYVTLIMEAGMEVLEG